MPTSHAPRRISKHDLKTDQFSTSIFAAREWVEKNLRTTLIVAGAIIVVGVAIWGVARWRGGQSDEALSLYGEAGVEMRSGNAAVAIAELQKILDEHKGSKIAGPACFQLAELHFRQRNFDDARVFFQRYINDYGDDLMLKSAAWAGQGAVDEQAGFYGEATTKYEKAIEVDPKGFRVPEYWRTIVRTAIAANDSTKALSAFERLRKDFPRDAQNIGIAREMLIEHGMLDPGKT